VNLDRIHRAIDASGVETYIFERAAFLLLELVLLALGALPVVTDLRSGIFVAGVGILRLTEAEVRREEASVMGRHRERGGISELPEHKRKRAAWRARMLERMSWYWPSLVLFALAAASRSYGAALWVGLGSVLVRAAWARLVMPAWRRSRIAWRKRQERVQRVQALAHRMASRAGEPS